MRTINRTIVSAHLYSSDGKLFMALNADDRGGTYPGCWKLPGGGIEEGEEKIEGLIREIKEETGLDISTFPIEPIDYVMHGESEKTLVETGERVLAKMEFNSYKVQLDKPASDIVVSLDPNEFKEYRWYDIADLKLLQLSPPGIELFTKLGFL